MKSLEKLFSDYLSNIGLFWDYERAWGTKKPDFTIYSDSQKQEIIAVVEIETIEMNKEEWERAEKGIASSIDPYGRIREKINTAREQLKFAKDYPCLLVIINSSPTLDSPLIVLSSMLGDLGIQIPLKKDGGTIKGKEQNILGKNGKMVDAKHRTPQNTTITAIGVLKLEKTDSFISGYEKHLHTLVDKHIKDISNHEQTKKYFTEAKKIEVKYKKMGFDLNKELPTMTFTLNPLSRKQFPTEFFSKGFTTIHSFNLETGEFSQSFSWKEKLG